MAPWEERWRQNLGGCSPPGCLALSVGCLTPSPTYTPCSICPHHPSPFPLRARCMRVPPPASASCVELAAAAALAAPAAVAAPDKDAEAGEPGLERAADGSCSDGGLAKAAADCGAAEDGEGSAAAPTHVPHPHAPAGLFYVSAGRQFRVHRLGALHLHGGVAFVWGLFVKHAGMWNHLVPA